MESLDKHNSSPSFVRPFLYALNRMQANEILRPVQYMDRAKMLLIDRLGMSGPIPEAAFSHGVVGLMADHTHYFEGFALGLRLRQGVAVAIRSNDLQYHRLILEGTGDVQVSKEASYGDAELSSLLIHTIDALDGAGGRFFDVSIVGSIPTGLGASFVGALTVSLIRGLNTFDNVPSVESKVRVQALAALNAWYNNRFSPRLCDWLIVRPNRALYSNRYWDYESPTNRSARSRDVGMGSCRMVKGLDSFVQRSEKKG